MSKDMAIADQAYGASHAVALNVLRYLTKPRLLAPAKPAFARNRWASSRCDELSCMIFEQSCERQNASMWLNKAEPMPRPRAALSTTTFSTTAKGRRPNMASAQSETRTVSPSGGAACHWRVMSACQSSGKRKAASLGVSTPQEAIGRLTSLGFPVFVKPAYLGSSVGISKANNETELRHALRLAFELDRRVIVEAATSEKPREVEVGILGNDDPQASPVGELTFDSEFYDYETKYTEDKAAMHVPANLPAEIAGRARALAIEAFRVLDCAGLARVDFFYVESSGELFLNEVNTIPGFTKTSMYPELWRAAGMNYADLVSRLVELAQERR